MADTPTTRATILATLFPDNSTQQISPQDQRDAVVSIMGVGAQIYTSGGSTGTSVGTSYVTVPFASDGEEDLAIADAANDRIEVGASGDGVYLAIGQFSFSGTASATFTLKLAVDGSRKDAISCKRKVNSSGDVESASFVGLVSLADGEYVTVEVAADAASKTFTLVEGSLTLARLW